jgi:hypothetical protein
LIVINENKIRKLKNKWIIVYRQRKFRSILKLVGEGRKKEGKAEEIPFRLAAEGYV